VDLTLAKQKKKRDPKDPQKLDVLREAVLPTTCFKCGGYGHLPTDCWASAATKKYELLKDDEEARPVNPVLYVVTPYIVLL